MKHTHCCLPARLLARTKQVALRRRAFRQAQGLPDITQAPGSDAAAWSGLHLPAEHQHDKPVDQQAVNAAGHPDNMDGDEGYNGGSGSDGVPPAAQGAGQQIRYLTAYATDWRISCGIVQCNLHPVDEVGLVQEAIAVSGGLRALDLWMREGELVHAIVAQNSPVPGAYRLLSAMGAADLNLDESDADVSVDDFDDGWAGYEHDAVQDEIDFYQHQPVSPARARSETKSLDACRVIRRVWRKTAGGWKCKH